MTSSLLPQCSDPQVICYVADQCSSAVQLDEEQLLRAADRCVQLGSPAAAFELCLTDRRRADSKAREVARLLDEDVAPEVVAALARRSAPPGQAPPAVSLLELSPAYAAVFARLVEDREAIQ